ncbi:MAG: FAD:protein FMN transferase [Candidatus Marinimicrobia bacterium]|nr:FAD:protein FMN transferase [Candidatus Neomarinimicrobiota bacterium]
MIEKLILFIKKAHNLGFFLFTLFLIIGCDAEKKVFRFVGETMGTTYSITVVDRDIHSKSNRIKNEIDSVLVEINRQMSTYDHESEISKLNDLQSDNWFSVSQDFHRVLSKAKQLSQQSNGLFDITVMPLVTLWGFRYSEKDHDWQPPSQQKIDSVLSHIGSQYFELDINKFRKLKPTLQIDVNAIAKGYGVDAIANLLNSNSFANYLVEIGGEIRCSGKNQQDNLWSIGIDSPALNSMPGVSLYSIVGLSNTSMATSGDYRNYTIYKDELYSHVINPQTGYPTKSVVSSATVITPTCMMADGLATMLLVMEPEAGIRFINALEDSEGLLIVRNSDSTFSELKSEGFDSYIKN